MKDKFNREIDYLRISLTEACNLRCIYCMPDGDVCFKNDNGLTDDEIKYLIDIFGDIGLKKIRFTGGEPLLRKNIVELVSKAKEKEIGKIALTTNGVLLPKYLDELINAGLNEINISLDSLNEDVFKKITRGGNLISVVESIKKAVNKGIKVKINAVIVKGINDNEFLDLCKLSIHHKLDIRFIELMPIGEGTKYTGVSGKDLEKILKENFNIKEAKSDKDNGPAFYYRIEGAEGRVGFISALSNHFCESCNRIRITPDGVLKQCLHFKSGLDLKNILREDTTRE
ncbi:GTP 3',8-cyclase MoaA [Clostridium paraputrificum]|uniref:GTP 3',8-cyclase MoaA n=2 Tax=Clostridiaceae TaxID=31979 RepID=UPI001FA8D51C|nr:GTP 3',8-cyclase MoaA [Clostridium paraputrificum]